MLERFTEMKDEIKITMALLNRKNLPIITEDEWLPFLELCGILKPFAEITASMSGEKYVTGGDVIVVTRILTATCQRFLTLEEHMTHAQSREFVQNLQADIDERLGDVEKMKPWPSALFLIHDIKWRRFRIRPKR